MGYYEKFDSQKLIVVDGVRILKKTYKLFDNGSCQCFKDCDCYLRKGKPEGEYNKFKHPLKDKYYYHLDSCIQSLESCLKTK